MLGIEKEAAIFLYACLSGLELYFCYRILHYFRHLVRHAAWAVNLEDVLYWLGVSIYLFRQMNRTKYVEIRWFFVLGVLSGVWAGYKGIRFLNEIKKKSKKYLEKRNENR